MGPPTASLTVERGASIAAATAVAAKRTSAINALASQSSTMYAVSAAVRCQFTGVRRRPARCVAATTSANSGRLAHRTTTPSPACTPRARSARTSWLARASSSPKVRSPHAETSAGRSGSASAWYEIARPRSAAPWSSSKLIAAVISFPRASKLVVLLLLLARREVLVVEHLVRERQEQLLRERADVGVELPFVDPLVDLLDELGRLLGVLVVLDLLQLVEEVVALLA